MTKKLLFALVFFASNAAWAQTAENKDVAAIRRVMAEQVQAWDKGDMQAFMEGYWRSDSLRFIGSKGIVYGWQPTLERYQKNYPDAVSRGTLRFDILRVELIGKDAAFVIGRFHLTRPQAGDASGHFTLLWRKISGKWRIVVDHTS
ncbi:MAG: nuclear transport factor 2 family protein [Cytophagales bacterium]|jgi:uncharacterized protein (TIGR02246 family)|nr:nuclear transport factor 2 family protein [Cytophagales bacterium]